MKIERRGFLSPLATSQLWLVPTMVYLFQKIAGVKHNELEWLWWAFIPSMFTLWFFINWRIKKNS